MPPLLALGREVMGKEAVFMISLIFVALFLVALCLIALCLSPLYLVYLSPLYLVLVYLTVPSSLYVPLSLYVPSISPMGLSPVSLGPDKGADNGPPVNVFYATSSDLWRIAAWISGYSKGFNFLSERISIIAKFSSSNFVTARTHSSSHG